MGRGLNAPQYSTFAADQRLEVTVCTCGVLFAVSARMLAQRRSDGKVFYCPHGHNLSYHETEDQRLRKRLEQERDRAGRLASERDQVAASLRAQKGATTRLKRRVAAGTCPCCKRTFKQLSRHMSSQHPEYGAAA